MGPVVRRLRDVTVGHSRQYKIKRSSLRDMLGGPLDLGTGCSGAASGHSFEVSLFMPYLKPFSWFLQ